MALVAAALSGALYVLLYPPFGAAWLAWVALVPLVLALRGRGPRAAAGLGAVWAFVATVGIVAWLVPTLRGHFGRSPAVSLGFLLLVGALSAAPFCAAALSAWAAARPAGPAPRAAALRALGFAAAFVAAELLRSQIGLRSPWARLGDAQVAAERLRQIADLGGVYAVSFVVALGNAAAAEAAVALRARRVSTAAAPLGVFAAVLVLALGYGELRLRAQPERGPVLDVALVQGDVAPELRWRRTAASQVLRRYGGLTRDLLLADGPRPDLVLWPENAVQTPPDDPVYGPPLRALARGAPLLVGAPRSEQTEAGRRHFNSAYLLSGRDAAEPGNGEVHTYDKRRLLPFSETRPLGLAIVDRLGDLAPSQYTPGREPGVFPHEKGALGVLICMEALYPELARETARAGARVLVNLSNDSWYRGGGGAEQHLAQVIFRAVETRRPLLRVTTTGISAVIAPDGRVTHRLEAGEAGVLRAAVRVPPARSTPYLRAGDAFAWACALGCLLPPLGALARRARGPRPR